MLAFTNQAWRGEPEERDYAIRIWDVNSGQLRLTLEGHTDFVNALAFSQDSSVLVSAGDDGTLRLWDTSSGEELLVVQETATALAFSHDGTLLASSNVDGRIQLWGIQGDV